MLKAFSASNEMVTWFLSLNPLMWHITVIGFHMLKHPFVSGVNPMWSWCIILSMCCWIQFASHLLRVITLIFMREMICNFFSFRIIGFGVPWKGVRTHRWNCHVFFQLFLLLLVHLHCLFLWENSYFSD